MNWKDKYEIKSKNIGGGQGDCYIVEDKKTQSILFLKKLKNHSTERRSRFFRETTLFQSLNIDGIPRIIDTNVHNFESKEDLYYCSEFIDGQQLDSFVAKNDIDEKLIVNFSIQLFSILQKIHSQEIVHRDIKPENIIIAEGKLYLVDFGISVIKNDTDRLTITGQEIGNRFLRLPEFSAGSNSKRDTRSDLTLAVGISLYMLTKRYPRNLVNENGEYAHQTPESIKILGNVDYSIPWNNIFDRAFQQDLSKRWSQSDEIIQILDLMKKVGTENKSEVNKVEEYLKLHAKSVQSNNLGLLKKNLIELNGVIKKEVSLILNNKAKGFRTEEMGWVYNLGETENRNQIRAYPIGKKEHTVIEIITQLIGEQIVGILEINGNKEEVCRVKTNETLGDYENEKMSEIISSKVLPEFMNLIKNGL